MTSMQNFIIITILLSSLNSYATIKYNNIALDNDHISLIKGFIYDISHYDVAQQNKDLKLSLSKLAKAINWLEICHKSKKIFHLTNIENKSIKIINKSIVIINNIITNQYPQLPAPQLLSKWQNLGSRVAVYKKNIKAAHWAFKLSSHKETKNLVYICDNIMYNHKRNFKLFLKELI